MTNNRKPITVTRPFLPERKKFDRYIDGIFSSAILTNNGPLVQELTIRLKEFLNVEYLILVANGTLAMQIAFKTLGIRGRAVTTPFTFVATSSSMVWEGITPIYADIDRRTFCLNPELAEKAIVSSGANALVPVHVFGNACDVDALDAIARRYNLKCIYDAAHAFGIKYKGSSLLGQGDASIVSFHATKVFHTLEGGAIVFRRREDFERAKMLANFGQDCNGRVTDLGINAKMNEISAAMGLCALDEWEEIVRVRGRIWNYYSNNINKRFLTQHWVSDNQNYGYFPVILGDENKVGSVLLELRRWNIFPRRYFHPPLHTISTYGNNRGNLRFAEELSAKILCLPLSYDMRLDDLDLVVNILEQFG